MSATRLPLPAIGVWASLDFPKAFWRMTSVVTNEVISGLAQRGTVPTRTIAHDRSPIASTEHSAAVLRAPAVQLCAANLVAQLANERLPLAVIGRPDCGTVDRVFGHL